MLAKTRKRHAKRRLRTRRGVAAARGEEAGRSRRPLGLLLKRDLVNNETIGDL